MAKSIEHYFAEVFVKAYKEREEKEVIRPYNHFKRYSETPWMKKHVDKLYNNYFKSKYEFRRMSLLN